MHAILVILFSVISMNSLKPQPKIDTAQMRKEILAEFAKQPTGTFAVAFKDISTGEIFLMNAHESFHAASTMKTAILIETFKQATGHKFSLTDSILIKNSFKSIVDGSPFSLDSADDSEKDLYTRIGTKLPVNDLLYRMITESSNLATDLIVDLVGAENANKTMHELGAKDIKVLRGVEDNKAYDLGLNNTVTAYDLMVIFDHIADGTVVNKKACDAMIKILMHQHFREKIPALLPADVRTATKSGSIDKISHDSGIVFLPDGRKYVVVLLSRGIEDEKSADETLARISRIIYNYMANENTKNSM
ncbi:MAG: serine hydrolase [Chitinophagaceae bacterium]|nr:MAG: serine hydrolase [Chitinophagaceae bacterium]